MQSLPYCTFQNATINTHFCLQLKLVKYMYTQNMKFYVTNFEFHVNYNLYCLFNNSKKSLRNISFKSN